MISPSCSIAAGVVNIYGQEVTQRILMKVRVEFQDCFKFTIAMDKSKVGKELMTLVYLYCSEKHLGSMLPPQAAQVSMTDMAMGCCCRHVLHD